MGLKKKNERGAALVEFAVVSPIMLIMLLGGMRFGLAVNNYVIMTEAVRASSRLFALSRASTTPRTTAFARLQSSAPGMTINVANFATSVNGVACATDSACQTAMANAVISTPANPYVTVGACVSWSVSVMRMTFGTTCTGATGGIASQMTERLE